MNGRVPAGGLPGDAAVGQRWYDGAIYAWFYDPFERAHKERIASLVQPGSRVLDVACGTGALCLVLGRKAASVLGVDGSPRMLARARRAAERKGARNVSFCMADAARLSSSVSGAFDFAVFSLFFHEVEEPVRMAALEAAAKLSRRVILSDFSSPQPASFIGRFNVAVERVIGGRENFRCFRDFQAGGGVRGLARRLDLPIEHFSRDPGGSRDFLVVRGQAPAGKGQPAD